MLRDEPPIELPLVVAITGASGAVYATRLLEVLLDVGREVHLLISPSGASVVKQELQRNVSLERFDPRSLLPDLSQQAASQIRYHHYQDFMAAPASGSFLTGGMVVCPCSGS